MTTEQEEKLRSIAITGFEDGLIAVVESIEKQAAIDALAKAERIQEKQNEIPSSEYERYLAICARCGTLSAYLTNFIDQMTPDQREIIAIQFDQNLFGTDKAMAERFRNANNASHENN